MVYILARQDPAACELAARVHSIFFLGTPHRGSEMATVLENMLTVALGKKPFVADLIPNSAALSAINDTFRHLAPALRLWSFYETLPVRAAGVMNRIVVERHSATLGYHNEEIAAMDADHRHVCKFSDVSDANYKILRNALLTAVDAVRATSAPNAGADYSGQSTGRAISTPTTPLIAASMSAAQASLRLRAFLRIRNSADGDLTALQLFRQPGSCEWLIAKDLFVSWKTGTAPQILWLVGKPAAGKSVLASHIVEHLMPEVFCSYFICKHGKTGQSTLSDCLKSLAFQMAMQDRSVQETLLRLEYDGFVWDETDDTSVWRRLFTAHIFQLPSMHRHFWVIDGVDECWNFNSLFTKRYLSTLPDGLRLFATSRKLEEIERGVAGLGPSRAKLHVLSDTETLADMRLFLTTRLAELGQFESDRDRELMCEKILSRCSGSFLWARLVLQEFGNMWTEEAMDAVLREVPADLHDLYSRMMQSIETDSRKAVPAEAILKCVVLACRPLTVDELRCIVKLDVNQTLQNVTKAIPDLCGQMVYIDQDDRVHLIHETAREFLLAKNLGCPPVVAKSEGHTRLGSLLLRYLSSDGLQQQQIHTRQSSGWARSFTKRAGPGLVADSTLVEYASSFFSEHLYRATSEDDNLMEDLCQFLKADAVLSWIERIAQSGDLADLTRTAMNMREYLVRRTKYLPPTHPSIQLIECWVTDLIRVAAKFRTQLLTCPSSIHCLIPPLYPFDSMLRRTFVDEPGRMSALSSTITVGGLPADSWEDCLVRLDFQKGQAITICHGHRFFAVGLSTGQISLYEPRSLQCVQRLTHPERVKGLHFSYDDLHLASWGARNIVIWDPINGTMTHSFSLGSCLAVAFIDTNELLCATQSSELAKW
jgi:hypothetical protein